MQGSSARRRLILPLVCLLLLLAGLITAAAIVWPDASGSKVKTDSMLTVDLSNAESGYIMVCSQPSSKRMKLRIKKGKYTMTYDLNSSGYYEVFPLQLGSGKYSISLYQNSSGKKYSSAGAININVNLSSEYAPFLCPNQYVNYNSSTEAVAISNQICAGLTTDKEKFEAIQSYIRKNYMYDFIKSVQVMSGDLPDIDYCTTNKMGICQDLAATAACMLRVQGIPTRLMIGYAGKQYHAWTSVLIDGKEITYDPTAEVGGISGKIKYSLERYY